MLEQQTGAIKDDIYMQARGVLKSYLDDPKEDVQMPARIAMAYLTNWTKQFSALRSTNALQFHVYQFIGSNPKEVKKRVKAAMPHLIK